MAWLAVQTAELTPSDGAGGDQFGLTVALDGDTALVGANNHVDDTGTGAAYVFVYADGGWTEQQELTVADGDAGDGFGWSVALSGDTALVGAPLRTIGANANEGAAYVFARSDGTWTQQQELTAAAGAAGDSFGYSVALDGDTALVGERSQSPVPAAAYIFTRSDGAWTQQQELTAAAGAFGAAVALSGDTALVGAPYLTVGDNGEQGAAYVFSSSNGSWTLQRELTAADGAAGDELGYSVALDGDTALLGAQGHAVGGHSQEGAAYLFTRSDGSWTQHQELTASDGAADFGFGWSVSLSGATALVGVPFTAGSRGSAYFFQPVVSPANTAAPVVSGDTTLGDTLTCTSGGWTGDPTPSLTYQWQRDGVAVDGATSDTYTVGTADQGHLLSCLVTATNPGATLAETSNLVAVPATPGAPTGTQSPALSGAAVLGQVVSCSSGGWSGTVESLSYQWLHGGVAVHGATASTYRVARRDCGASISCIVTATNYAGQTSAASNDLTVPAAPAVRLKASRRVLTAGESITISGTVRNSLAVTKKVCICRRLNHRLIVLRRLTLRGSGSFHCIWRSHRGGRWRFVATYTVAGCRFTSRAVGVVVHKA